MFLVLSREPRMLREAQLTQLRPRGELESNLLMTSTSALGRAGTHHSLLPTPPHALPSGGVTWCSPPHPLALPPL